jgi:hypothetical protein
MPDMEDKVRDLLERRASDVEPNVTVPPTLARRAHRRFAAFAGVAAVVVVVLVAGAAAALRNVPGAPVDQPGGDGQSPSAVVAGCTADDLTASATLEGAAGSREGAILVENASATTCTLESAPAVALLGTDGLPVSTIVNVVQTEPAWRVDGRSAPDGWPVVTLAPGDKASLRVSWSNWCGDPSPTWTLVLADGSSVQVANIGVDAPPCNGPGQPSTIQIGPFEPAH